MATNNRNSQPQPQWPFIEKPLPTIHLTSSPPEPPYPDTFESIESATTSAPIPTSVGPFLRFSYAIYGFNHVVYYN